MTPKIKKSGVKPRKMTTTKRWTGSKLMICLRNPEALRDELAFVSRKVSASSCSDAESVALAAGESSRPLIGLELAVGLSYAKDQLSRASLLRSTPQILQLTFRSPPQTLSQTQDQLF